MIKLPKIFQSKLFLGGALILLAIVFVLELRQWQQRHAIDKEIEALITQEKQLEQKNKDLEQSLQYFASNDYKEKLAREQLGLKKEGEIVINFPNLNNQSTENQQSKLSNPQKWWQHFFLN